MSSASSKCRKWSLGSAGATSLELALVFGVFMIMLIGSIDLSRYFYTVHALTTLTTDTLRYSLIAGTAAQTPQPLLLSECAPQGDQAGNLWCGLYGQVVVPPLLDPSQVRVCIVSTATVLGFGVNVAQVTVTYPFTAMLPLLSGLSGTVTAQAGQAPCDASPPANTLVETVTYAY